MRRLLAMLAPLSLLPLAVCAARPEREPEVATLRRAAFEARARPDWRAARRALEEAELLAPDDPEVTLELADLLLLAFGDVMAARRRYAALYRRWPARSLHGQGLCALWEGEEDRALELFRASLAEAPTAACARDLALRLLGRGEPATEELDLVEEISGQSLRSELLLAAAGRRPRPARLPGGWSYGLERARLLGGESAAREVEAYLERACATPGARARMRAILAGDPVRLRNFPRPHGVMD